MRPLKVGDRVKISSIRSAYARKHSDEIATITKVHMEMNEPLYYILNDTGNGVWPDEVELYKKDFNCEADYLDAFKNNFKDGV